MPKTINKSRASVRKAKYRTKTAVAKGTEARTDAKMKMSMRPRSKLDQIVTLMRRPSGATINQIVTATGWQAHSVRGAISGSLKKKLGLAVKSERSEGTCIYRIAVG